jgi:hypothetical protein
VIDLRALVEEMLNERDARCGVSNPWLHVVIALGVIMLTYALGSWWVAR